MDNVSLQALELKYKQLQNDVADLQGQVAALTAYIAFSTTDINTERFNKAQGAAQHLVINLFHNGATKAPALVASEYIAKIRKINLDNQP